MNKSHGSQRFVRLFAVCLVGGVVVTVAPAAHAQSGEPSGGPGWTVVGEGCRLGSPEEARFAPGIAGTALYLGNTSTLRVIPPVTNLENLTAYMYAQVGPATAPIPYGNCQLQLNPANMIFLGSFPLNAAAPHWPLQVANALTVTLPNDPSLLLQTVTVQAVVFGGSGSQSATWFTPGMRATIIH